MTCEHNAYHVYNGFKIVDDEVLMVSACSECIRLGLAEKLPKEIVFKGRKWTLEHADLLEATLGVVRDVGEENDTHKPV